LSSVYQGGSPPLFTVGYGYLSLLQPLVMVAVVTVRYLNKSVVPIDAHISFDDS
jgi:hypothetical protein